MSVATARCGRAEEGGWSVAARRRLEAHVLRVFERWGYHEVVTPLIEPYDELARSTVPSVLAQTVRFVGPDGRVMALRPDMTWAVAKAVSGGGPGREPVRACYVGPVYRWTAGGQVREIYQAGVELIGPDGPTGDGEILKVCAALLDEIGMDGWRMGVGHVGLVRSLLGELGMNEAGVQAGLRALSSGSRVELEQMLPDTGSLAREALLGAWSLADPELLPGLGAEATLECTKREVEELRGLLSAAAHPSIRLDLGVIRDFDYYTGVVLAVYAPGCARAIGGGGRYDGLLVHGGASSPAAGFALSLSELLSSPRLGAFLPTDGLH